jgi:hypothetical protein
MNSTPNPTIFVLSIYDGTLFNKAMENSFWAFREYYKTAISEMKKDDILLFVKNRQPNERKKRVFAVAKVSLMFQRYNAELDRNFGPSNEEIGWTDVESEIFNHGIVYKNLIILGDYNIYTGQKNKLSVINYTKNKYRLFSENIEKQYEDFIFSVNNPEKKHVQFKPITESPSIIHIKSALVKLAETKKNAIETTEIKLIKLSRSKRRAKEEYVYDIIEQSELKIKKDLEDLIIANNAYNHFLENELKRILKNESDNLTKSISEAIADSANTKRVVLNEPTISSIYSVDPNEKVLLLVNEMQKTREEHEAEANSDCDDKSECDSDSDDDSDSDAVHAVSKYNCIVS